MKLELNIVSCKILQLKHGADVVFLKTDLPIPSPIDNCMELTFTVSRGMGKEYVLGNMPKLKDMIEVINESFESSMKIPLKELIEKEKGIELFRMELEDPLLLEDFEDCLDVMYHAKLPLSSKPYEEATEVYGFIIRRREEGKDHIVFQLLTDEDYVPVSGDITDETIMLEPRSLEPDTSMEDTYILYEDMWRQTQISTGSMKKLCEKYNE